MASGTVSEIIVGLSKEQKAGMLRLVLYHNTCSSRLFCFYVVFGLLARLFDCLVNLISSCVWFVYSFVWLFGLFVCLFVCLFVFLLVLVCYFVCFCLFVCMFVCMYVCLCVCLFGHFVVGCFVCYFFFCFFINSFVLLTSGNLLQSRCCMAI